MITPQKVADFLGQDDDGDLLVLAGEHLAAVTALVKGWTRGQGFAPEPADDLAAVILTATARLVSNPAQLTREELDGYTVTGSFSGFTLPEQMILNRYRRRAA